LRLALRAIAGPDGLDAHVPPIPWRDCRRPEAGELRIAWSAEFPESSTQDEIRTSVQDVVQRLAGEGATVGETVPDVDPRRQYDIAEEIFELLAGTFSASSTAFSEETDAASRDGEHISLGAYLMALEQRDEVMSAWNGFFTEWDALVLPAGTSTAERHGEEPTDPAQEYPYALSAVSGCPMVVVPSGVDKQGLPFGLQVLGGRWHDERLLAIAELLSTFTHGFRRPPGY
jgi:amidase